MSKAIDKYIELRSSEVSDVAKKVDPRLQDLIDALLRRCIDIGEHKQAIGIALEAHRLDLILHIYKLNGDVSLLTYAMDSVLDTHFPLTYRDEVLRFLLPLFNNVESD